jgi:septum formation protein
LYVGAYDGEIRLSDHVGAAEAMPGIPKGRSARGGFSVMGVFRFILASSSARRRELLRRASYTFEVLAPTLSELEIFPPSVTPHERAEALAYYKARAVAAERFDVPVLGADTIVAVGDAVLGKPADEVEARWMLRSLSGTRHQVITGIALLCPSGRRIITSDTTHVTMRKLSAEEIDAYVASNEWVDKAGAYAIQETADRFVQKIEGSFSNVVGLPMELLERVFELA